jgi:hypothetical protein
LRPPSEKARLAFGKDALLETTSCAARRSIGRRILNHTQKRYRQQAGRKKNGALKTSTPFCFSLSKPICRLGSSNLLKHPQAEEPVGGGQVQVDRLQQFRGDWHVGHSSLMRHLGCLQNIHHDCHLIRW